MPSARIPTHEITAKISELSWSFNWHISPLLAYFSVKGHCVPFLIVHKLSPGASLKILVTDVHLTIKILPPPQLLAYAHTF